MPHTSSRIYIDALAIVPERKSGIGYALEQTLQQYLRLPEVQNYQIYLVVPFGKAKYLQQYVNNNVRIKTVYLPAKVMSQLLRFNLFPPIDWLLGRGLYIFTNYRNWPVWNSRSMTYIYDVAFMRYPETVKPKNQKYLERYSNKWIARTDKIITITNVVKQEIEKYLAVPHTKIETVYCGVDTSVFYKRSQAEVTTAKELYDIPFKRYFLFVGNIEPRKNLLTLLDAYEKLPSRIQKEYGLVLIGGDGWLNETFYARVLTLQQAGLQIKKIERYVATVDLPAIYSGATALIHPAIYEGFGITPLEAMACETPVVVSDIPAVREITGDAATYFDPLSSDDLLAAVILLVKNPDTVSPRTAAGLAKAHEFSWEASAQQLQQVIEGQLAVHESKRPIVNRLKRIYSLLDRNIRQICGEKVLKPYSLRDGLTIAESRTQLYGDYLREQPSAIQNSGLKLYLKTKHLLVVGLKRSIGLIRGRV
jgi:glycosyltransferase involved in cell wall biosynthesis